MEKVDRHWWYGCCGGKYGKFPGSYLVPVEIPSLEDNHELFAAVSDFPRQQDDDLAFTKGDLFHSVFYLNNKKNPHITLVHSSSVISSHHI